MLELVTHLPRGSKEREASLRSLKEMILDKNLPSSEIFEDRMDKLNQEEPKLGT